MDFNNLTRENKNDIICAVNYHYECSILHSVESVRKDKQNLELVIYPDETKENPVYIGINDFNQIINNY